jgi:hypothetical protein
MYTMPEIGMFAVHKSAAMLAPRLLRSISAFHYSVSVANEKGYQPTNEERLVQTECLRNSQKVLCETSGLVGRFGFGLI